MGPLGAVGGRSSGCCGLAMGCHPLSSCRVLPAADTFFRVGHWCGSGLPSSSEAVRFMEIIPITCRRIHDPVLGLDLLERNGFSWVLGSIAGAWYRDGRAVGGADSGWKSAV